MQSADGVYDHTKPWQSNEERLVSESLATTAGMPAAVIQQIRPPLPQVQLFPPKYGYRREAFGIRDVVNVNTIYPGARVDFSGRVSGYQGTSFPALNAF